MKVKYNHKFKDIEIQIKKTSYFDNFKIPLLKQLTIQDKRQLCYIALIERQSKIVSNNSNLNDLIKNIFVVLDRIGDFSQYGIDKEINLIKEYNTNLYNRLHYTGNSFAPHDLRVQHNPECYALFYFLNELKHKESVSYYDADSSITSCLYKCNQNDFIKGLIRSYLRNIKQFNIPKHNDTFYESIVKEILQLEFHKLEQVDKNQLKDILIENYELEDKLNVFTYKAIQREFQEIGIYLDESKRQEINS